MPLRREVVLGIGASLVLGACGQSISFESEPPKQKENFNRGPQTGDIIFYHGLPVLLRANIGMGISDLPQYLKNSKAAEYGRKVFDNLPDYALQDIIDRFPPQNVNAQGVFNEFSGLFRRKKPNGGEGLVFWPGALTYRGYPLGKDNEPFIHVRNRLESSKWKLQDCDFFTYGAVPFVDYTRLATLGAVDKNIVNALSFVNSLKISQPFEQQNHIAHSAGGIYAFEAVMRNMDITNNLIMIGVPIRGLKDTAGKVGEAIANLNLDPNLVSYLKSLPDNDEYQKRLDRLGEEFTRKGRKLTIIVHEDDPIAMAENAMIKGADLIILKGGQWDVHGAGLIDPLALQAIERKIGLNLAPIV